MATILQIGLENALAATILAALVAALAPVLKRRPALRHCLYLVVLLKLVTPPLWRVPILPTNESTKVVIAEPNEVPMLEEYQFVSALQSDVIESVIDSENESREIVEISNDPPIAVAPASTPFQRPAIPWVDLLGAAWIGGSLVCLILSVDRIRRFRMVLGLVKPAPESVEDLVNEVAERLELGRRPRVGMVAGAISPMVWSLGFRPFLLLPAELWGRLDNRQRTTLLAHEMAHLKRGDDWVRLFELAVTILFWWLPIVWRVRSTLRDAEEQCCDAWVVWAYPEASKAYAETLVETVDFLSGDRSRVPAFASGIGRVQHLKRRLNMIMKGTTPRTLGFSGTLAALTLSALLLPMSPTLAQNPDEKKEESKAVIIRHDDADSSADVLEKKIVASVDVGGNVKVVSGDDLKGDKFRIVVTGADAQDSPATKAKDAIGFTFTATSQESAMSEAVKKLSKTIKELQYKEKKSAEDEALIKALTQVIESLSAKNASWTKTKPYTAYEVIQQTQSRNPALIRQLGVRLDNSTPEQKATQDQLVARMKKLQAEARESHARMLQAQDSLEKTQKQLAEIFHQLASLHVAAGGDAEKNASDKAMKKMAELRHTVQEMQIQLAPVLSGPPVAPVPPVAPAAPLEYERLTRVQRPDQDRRIDELEKKLDRILNRLESNDKKDSQGSGPAGK